MTRSLQKSSVPSQPTIRGLPPSESGALPRVPGAAKDPADSTVRLAIKEIADLSTSSFR